MKICSIVGARPQFVKLAVMCRALARCPDTEGWVHRIIHTGQHYDPSLSAVFFQELMIPRPDHDLEVGSGSHGAQTGEMLKRLEPVLAAEAPDWILIYGDTNSTLSGALVGAKMGLALVHIEAGLRSHRPGMAEEINRVVADHLSQLLCCPTELAIENLRKEGLEQRAVLTGDVMYDAALTYRQLAENRGWPSALIRPEDGFALATVHRAENTDDPARLRAIIRALERIAAGLCRVLWPVHPRTRKRIEETRLATSLITMIEPVSYLDMLLLEGRARFILTDSGGVQKEAYFFKVPCITLRDETEWEETLENRCNVLTGCSEERILEAASTAGKCGPWKSSYGDGDAGSSILEALKRRTPASLLAPRRQTSESPQPH
jgi:UDP-GlcNAc3NAcA epimerase